MPSDLQIVTFAIFSILLILSLIVFIMLSIVRYRKARIEQLKKILELELKVREETLSYVGEELHDDIGQLLSLTKIHAFQIKEKYPDDVSITEILKLVSGSLDGIRNISHVLKKETSYQLDIIELLKNEKQKIEALGNYKVEIETNQEVVEIENHKIPFLHRIIQEAINNILKHAKANTILFEVEHQLDSLKINIIDDGFGFDPNAMKTKGIGISNMKERAGLIGAELVIDSSLGKGAQIGIILSENQTKEMN